MWKNVFDLVRQMFLVNDRLTRQQVGLDEVRTEVRDLAKIAEEGDRYLQRQIEQLEFEVKRRTSYGTRASERLSLVNVKPTHAIDCVWRSRTACSKRIANSRLPTNRKKTTLSNRSFLSLGQ